MRSYIHLIRHGITEGNLRRWFYGAADLPLAAEGLQALLDLRAEGIYPPLADADCYTSGMLRAEQSLTAIYGDVPRRPLPNLREMNFGSWECRTFEDLSDDPQFQAWMDDPAHVIACPGGDSTESFRARVRTGYRELLGLHRVKQLSHRHSGLDAISIVVCHGGVIAAMMEEAFPGQKASFWDWIPAPGRGYTVSLTDSEPAAYSCI